MMGESHPRFRFCILNWNSGRDLKECIDSISCSNYKNFSITVIDNFSTDLSLDLIDNHEIISLDKNYGFAKGYNLGLSRCISKEDEYLVLLNPDATIGEKFIEDLVDSINDYGANYIYGVKILFDEDKEKIWYAGGTADLSMGKISHNKIGSQNENINSNYLTDYITGCCMIVHKNIYNQLNGFDEQFFMYNEDVDLCLRAKQNKIELMFLSAPEVFHKISSSVGGRNSFKKIIMKIKSGYLLYNKYFNPFSALLLFVVYCTRSFVSFLFNK